MNAETQRRRGKQKEKKQLNAPLCASASLRSFTDAIMNQEDVLRQGGGEPGQERQRKAGRLPVRERLRLLLDKNSPCGPHTGCTARSGRLWRRAWLWGLDTFMADLA